jgi:capsular exopolysaccharide synthesis family protein
MANDHGISKPELTAHSSAPGPHQQPSGMQQWQWGASGSFTPLLQSQGAGTSAYFHALRRRWLLAILLGLVCCVPVGLALWNSKVPQYTAVSLLRIAVQEETLVFKTSDQLRRNDFEVYKRTQQQLLRSGFLLSNALKRPEVAGLEMIQEKTDPVGWLSKNLSVDFPGEAEIMRVSLKGDRPRDVAVIVDAVVSTYMDEVVDVERNRRKQRLQNLDRVFVAKEEEIRKKREKLEALAEQLGTGDTDALSLKQQLALQRFAEFRRELTRHQFELRNRRAELAARKAMLEDAAHMKVSDAELAARAEHDPVYNQLRAEMAQLENALAHINNVTTDDTAHSLGEPYRRDLALLQSQLKQRREELRAELKRKQMTALEADVRQIASEIRVAEEQAEQLAADVREQRVQAEKVGKSSIDVEMRRAELDQLEQVLARIAEERERLRVEIGFGSRIALVQPAEIPKSRDQTNRFTQTVYGSLLGFAVPVLGIVWWEVRKQRINSSDEVAQGLGMNVLGSVPVVPSRAIRQLTNGSRRAEYWRDRLSESVDRVVAMLLRKAAVESEKVILVSSATSGEGKTTLATQIALNLARTGHRTVLVDFDLRRPGMDKIFGLPLEPGVSEVLRGESQPLEVIQHTDNDDLWLMTAGLWDRHAHAALARGNAGVLFDQLRTVYDFVVVDGSPILPVADTRFLGQHVDGVILSVLQDISQAPRVKAARQTLGSLGIPIAGAVMIGSNEDMCCEQLGYELQSA